jgi:hypothetical protein
MGRDAVSLLPQTWRGVDTNNPSPTSQYSRSPVRQPLSYLAPERLSSNQQILEKVFGVCAQNGVGGGQNSSCSRCSTFRCVFAFLQGIREAEHQLIQLMRGRGSLYIGELQSHWRKGRKFLKISLKRVSRPG